MLMNDTQSPAALAQDVSRALWLWLGGGICAGVLLLLAVIVIVAYVANIRRK